MSERYRKEEQNYNFWNEQARINQNDNETYTEQHTEQVSTVQKEQAQENTALQEEHPKSALEYIQAQNSDAGKIIENQNNMNANEAIKMNNNVNTNEAIRNFNNDVNTNEAIRNFNNDVNTNEAIENFNYNINTNGVGKEFGYANMIEEPANTNIDNNLNPYPNIQNEQEAFLENNKAKKQKNNTMKKILSLAASAAIFGIVAGAAFTGVQYVGNKLFPDKKVETEKTTINQNSDSKISTTTVSDKNNITGPTDVTTVVEKTMPSIVSITSKITMNNGYFGTQDQEGSGSGIIINKSEEELLIVTNNHVIEEANTISVKFIDGNAVEAIVKGTSSTADLAVLSIPLKNIKEDTLNKISVVEMGNSEDIKVGQMSIAIGNALGYGQSVTVGYISAKDREVEVEEAVTMKLLQTDAAINPGNSGGALLDKDGKLIGINSAKYSDTAVEGMGYAIPVSEATPIINDLMNREVLSEEEKGYLGVMIGESSEVYNMPEGAYISAVSEDGAAKEAGILVGDIITKVDNIEIKTSKALQEKVNSLRAGTKIKVTLMRYANGAYEEKKLEVTLKGKETLNDLEENTNQSQDSNGNIQQNPNQGNDNNGNNNERNYNNGQPIDPSDEESLEEFFEYYFGE